MRSHHTGTLDEYAGALDRQGRRGDIPERIFVSYDDSSYVEKGRDTEREREGERERNLCNKLQLRRGKGEEAQVSVLIP